MRRADRLFEIVQQLRGDRVVTAKALAERFEVSVRTIYRDVCDLQASGVPIDGEAGIGYLLRPGFQLPPLMFTPGEIEALLVGARMVEAWAGTRLASAAAEAMVKIGAVVPAERFEAAGRVAIFAPGRVAGASLRERFDRISAAIGGRARIRFTYAGPTGVRSERSVRPLALHFWGGVWTLAAWCELREDFRTFRIDRMDGLVETGERFPETPGRRLSDYLAHVTGRGPAAKRDQGGVSVPP
jgi:predicted DNA-binding transcriptional regulator YafY